MTVILTGAYRLFFPFAALFSALAVPLWLLALSGAEFAQPSDPFGWHRHEMLFGYLWAALAGFLLTAVPNWTGRSAVTGGPLLSLFVLWLVGRVAMGMAQDVTLLPIVALLFPLSLAGVVTRELWLGGNRRNLPLAGAVWLLVIADGLYLGGFADIGLRMGFGLALVMMVLIGGRVTPAFTRNWLKARGVTDVVPEFGMVDRMALIGTVVTVVLWVVLDVHVLVGWGAMFAALMLLVRVSRWHGWRVRAEPLMLALHFSYVWLAVCFALLSLHSLGAEVTQAQVVHGIGTGAIGTMTLIVMMRALLGHSNRPITANWADILILVCVHLAAVLRISAPLAGEETTVLHLSGMLWSAGFLGFAVRYLPIALQPRRETSH